MNQVDLAVGKFYWVLVVGNGLVKKRVVGKLLRITENDLGPVYEVETLDPESGKICLKATLTASEFVEEINQLDIFDIVSGIENRLNSFFKKER